MYKWSGNGYGEPCKVRYISTFELCVSPSYSSARAPLRPLVNVRVVFTCFAPQMRTM